MLLDWSDERNCAALPSFQIQRRDTKNCWSTRSPSLMSLPITLTKKQIFSALMCSMRTEEQITNRKTGLIVNKVMVTYSYPKDYYRVCVVKIPEGVRYTNIYPHLVDCYGHGKPAAEWESVVPALYRDALEKSSRLREIILSHFSSNKLMHY